MASHNSKVKISRLRLKTHTHTAQSLHTLLLVALLVSQSITSSQSSASYDNSDDFQGDESEGTVANEEIYNPVLLQQEVEAGENQYNMNNAEAETEAEMEMILNQTHTPTEMDKEAKSNGSLQLFKSAPTTSIPAYLRKTKLDQFLTNLSVADDSMSEDDEVHQAQQTTTKQWDLDDTLISDRMDMEEIVPLAMKYYQSGAKSLGITEHNDNKLKHSLPAKPKPTAMPAPTPAPMPAPLPAPLPQQQLPEYKAPSAKEQYQPSISDEEYYEDSADSDEAEHEDNFQQHNRITTSATHASTLASLTTPRNLVAPPGNVVSSEVLSDIEWSFNTEQPLPTPAGPISDNENTARPIDNPEIKAATITTPRIPHAAATPYNPNFPESPALTTSTVATTRSTTADFDDAAATMRPPAKQGKQINISRRKLLPHEQLRNYIEDAYIRMPLAVIVDPSAASLEKTKALWHDTMSMNLNIKIVLVSLNASGIPAAYTFNNTRQFLAGLNSIKEHTGGNSFMGILHASELVPYDSAVFISTASLPPHTELVQDAAITLLKKRIRLYVIWYGERAVSENETQEAVGGILGEVAIRSGGEIMHIVGNEGAQELEGSTLTLVAEAFRGSQELYIPVDTTLSSLHVKIDAPMHLATLETPNGG